jgi:hypothetical protein
LRIGRQVKDLGDEEWLRERHLGTIPRLTRFKIWLRQEVHTVLPKGTFGIAVNYVLEH